MRRFLPFSLLVLVSTACSTVDAPPALTQAQDSWFDSGAAAIQERVAHRPNYARAKNVILFLGDGMGISTVTATRIFDGQSRGERGEENFLSFERFPHTALVKTYNANQQVADSAGTASAINTGVKTRAGVFGISAEARRANCAEALAHAVPTLAEQAKARGMAVGVVTTARLTHATPGAVYAHTAERNWEADTDMPEDALEKGCRSIARQLVEFAPVGAARGGLDVALGGGYDKFGADLINAWQARFPNGIVVRTGEALDELKPAKTVQVLGLFSPSHMTYMQDRTPETAEPTLSQMTAKAIDILSRRGTGYYLMVEGGRIDHAHHEGTADKALREAQEFAHAIKVALDKVDLNDTLILVTADHSHVFTIAGYPARGNPILGLAMGNDHHGNPTGQPIMATDGKPYTTLGYHNGPGAVMGERPAPSLEPGARQQALVPTGSVFNNDVHLAETHGGEDVALYAAGPWSHLAAGVMEQHAIYHLMVHALGWDQ